MSQRPARSLAPEYFERIYARDPDPWRFASSTYEAQKYRSTLAALPRDYSRAFEIGCSIGVFTRMLAPRCRQLLAVDVVSAVLDCARTRCADLPQVRFAHMQVPRDLPPGHFDLIVASEVGYYLSAADLDRLAIFVCDRLLPGGHVVLVHWTPQATDYPLSGDAVHSRFRTAVKHDLQLRDDRREPTWRLDLFERPAAG